jgi:hypothetical protein
MVTGCSESEIESAGEMVVSLADCSAQVVAPIDNFAGAKVAGVEKHWIAGLAVVSEHNLEGTVGNQVGVSVGSFEQVLAEIPSVTVADNTVAVLLASRRLYNYLPG